MMVNNNSLWHEFKKGLWQDIPPFRLVLGTCPTLAVTNSVIRKIVPGQVRIAAYVVLIALYVTVADMFLAAMFPPISKALGPYVPLIVVNCIILARAEG